jgi:chemotaxis protein histidine kinase CheA
MTSRLLPTFLLVLLSGLVGCRAQEERRSLQNSVTRLEQRLARMDEYLKSLQQGQTQQSKEQADELDARRGEIERLRAICAELEAARKNEQSRHEKDAEEQRRRFEQEIEKARRTVGEVEKRSERAMQEQRDAMANEHRQLVAKLDREKQQMREQAASLEREAKELRDQLARTRAEHEQHAKSTEELRRDLDRARADVEAALKKAHALQGDKAEENALRAALKRSEAEQKELQKKVAHAEEVATHHAKKMQAALDALAEAKQAATQRTEAAPPPANDGLRALLRDVQSERKQIEQLRKQVANDLADKPRSTRVRSLAAPLAPTRSIAPLPVPAPAPAPAPATGGTTNITINNAEGEVHLHFHGNAPLLHPSRTPGFMLQTPAQGSDDAPEHRRAPMLFDVLKEEKARDGKAKASDKAPARTTKAKVSAPTAPAATAPEKKINDADWR